MRLIGYTHTCTCQHVLQYAPRATATQRLPRGWPANTPSIVRFCCGVAEVLWCTFRVLISIEADPDIDTGANSRGGGFGSAAHQQHGGEAALAKQEICLDHSSLCRSKRRGWVAHPMLPGAPSFLIFGEGGRRGHIFRFFV